jgi:hypothetical protein
MSRLEKVQAVFMLGLVSVLAFCLWRPGWIGSPSDREPVVIEADSSEVAIVGLVASYDALAFRRAELWRDCPLCDESVDAELRAEQDRIRELIRKRASEGPVALPPDIENLLEER